MSSADVDTPQSRANRGARDTEGVNRAVRESIDAALDVLEALNPPDAFVPDAQQAHRDAARQALNEAFRALKAAKGSWFWPDTELCARANNLFVQALRRVHGVANVDIFVSRQRRTCDLYRGEREQLMEQARKEEVWHYALAVVQNGAVSPGEDTERVIGEPVPGLSRCHKWTLGIGVCVLFAAAGVAVWASQR